MSDAGPPQIFYHVAVMNHWQNVVDEQLNALAATGLYAAACPMWVGVAGATPGAMEWLMRRLHGFNVVEMSSHKYLDAYERPTLRMLERRSKEVPKDTPLLYLHTKGLKDGKVEHKERWRYLMMREVVVRFRDCLEDLQGGADAVGVGWRDMHTRQGRISHFSGNFWWAKAGYIAQLAPLDAYYQQPRYPTNWDQGMRLGCEFWISSGPKDPVIVSKACRDTDLVKPSEVERVLAGG